MMLTLAETEEKINEQFECRKLYLGMHFYHVVVEYWKKLPRGVVKSLSLEACPLGI